MQNILSLYQHSELTQELQILVTGEPDINCQFCAEYPHTNKCCTYEPLLVNFLVGAQLHYKLISPNELLNPLYQPLGKWPDPQKQQVLTQNPELFGSSEAPLCENYKNSQCRVWPFNGARCMTYFCNPSKQTKDRWEHSFHVLQNYEYEAAFKLMADAGFSRSSIQKQVTLSSINSWELEFGGSKLEYYLWCYHQHQKS